MPFDSGENGDMQRTQAIILGVVAVVALAVIGFLFLSGGSDAPEASARPSASAAASASPAASAAASQELNADLLDRRWTVLYLGTDLNAAREAEGHSPSADALLVVTVSADQSEIALISLPRDTVDLPLPGGGTYPQKVNAMYAERGPEALAAGLEELYQLPIDGYVVLDMDDFIQLVDAVEGVDVDPASPLVDPIVQLDLAAGPQELDATEAQAYVRTRVDQDYGRMGRQQEVIMSLVDRLTDPGRDIELSALLDGLDSLETDLPLDDLATLLEVARRATDAEVRQLIIEPPLITFEGDRGDGRGYVLEPDVEAIRAAVRELVGEE